MVAFENGFLILAGPVKDPPSNHAIATGDYTVLSYNEGRKEKLLDLKSYGTKVKPEALLPLDKINGKLRLLLLFDGPDEGASRPVEIQ